MIKRYFSGTVYYQAHGKTYSRFQGFVTRRNQTVPLPDVCGRPFLCIMI